MTASWSKPEAHSNTWLSWDAIAVVKTFDSKRLWSDETTVNLKWLSWCTVPGGCCIEKKWSITFMPSSFIKRHFCILPWLTQMKNSSSPGQTALSVIFEMITGPTKYAQMHANKTLSCDYNTVNICRRAIKNQSRHWACIWYISPVQLQVYTAPRSELNAINEIVWKLKVLVNLNARGIIFILLHSRLCSTADYFKFNGGVDLEQ